MKEFLDKHQIGFTLDPNNPILLAQTLIQLDAEPEKLKLMGKKAAEIAKQEFDKTYLADKMLKAIEKIA